MCWFSSAEAAWGALPKEEDFATGLQIPSGTR